jgi:hypothetical protein
MREYRVGKAMHEGEPVSDVVASIVFTAELQKQLGIDLKKVGWFIGMQIFDDGIKKRVKSGELRSFSIGGRGIRRQIEEAA